MRSLSWSVLVAGLVPLLSCIGSDEPSLSEKWQDIKTRADYADFCGMDVCDDVEQGERPPCDCWCDYDGGDDVGASGDDGAAEGCTLTQGFWKNHSELQQNRSQAIDWPAPMDERDQLCGEGLLDILDTAPRSIAWTILAHQYVAASLNAAAGASTEGGVADALSEADRLLTSNCGGINGAERERALELSELLDAYNNGLLGPQHCED